MFKEIITLGGTKLEKKDILKYEKDKR